MAKRSSPWTWLAVGLLIVIIGGASVWIIIKLLPVGVGGKVQVRVQVLNALDDTVFTPADAVCNMFDAQGLTTMPTSDLSGPMSEIGGMSETPDGTYTSTAYGLEGEWVYLYITGTNFYTLGVFRQIPYVLSAGITNIATLETVRIQPNGGPVVGDVAPYITSGGARIFNGTNIATGVQEWKIDITATSGKTWGSAGYIAPATGWFYDPCYCVVNLTRTAGARMTIDSSACFAHYVIGNFEYWLLRVGSVPNDGDIPTDGTTSLFATVNNLKAGTDVLYIYGCWGGSRLTALLAGSFGTNYFTEAADCLWKMDLA
jgi:hypothetical protein